MASCLPVSTSEPRRNLPSLHIPATYRALLFNKRLRVWVNIKVHYPGRLSLALIPVLNQINLMNRFMSYFLRASFYLSSHPLLGFFQVFQIDFFNGFIIRPVMLRILCYVSFFYGDSVLFRVVSCRYLVLHAIKFLRWYCKPQAQPTTWGPEYLSRARTSLKTCPG